MKYYISILLCTMLGFGLTHLEAQSIKFNPDNGQFAVDIDPPSKAGGARKDPFWTYFWEFGDGTSSSDEKPRHCYSVTGQYDVRLSLTPFYSHDTTVVLLRTVSSSRGCTPDAPDPPKGLVEIETNVNNELVPGNRIRVQVDYRLPTNSSTKEGYLLFFFNGKSELHEIKLRFNPLIYKGEETMYNASIVPYNRLQQLTNVSAAGNELARTLLRGHDVMGFDCTVGPQNMRSLYLSLASSVKLDTTLIKGKKGQLKVHLKALWLPKDGTFDSETMFHEYPLQLLSVHDPNRYVVKRPHRYAYYRPKKPQKFDMQIDFQNLGGRPVKRVDIDMPWSPNFDYKTIKVTKRDPDYEECPPCSSDGGPAGTESCFVIDTSHVGINDTVSFIFYNVMIHGKREPGVNRKKHTKGYVRFTAESNKKRSGVTRHQAKITFEAGESFVTNKVRKRWRHLSYGLRAGRTLIGDIPGYEYIDDRLEQWYSGSLYFKNSALHTGLGWGLELGSSGLGFAGCGMVERAFDNFIVQQYNRESINIKTIDLQAQIEMRLANTFLVGFGGGPTLPLRGSGELSIASNFGFESPLSDPGVNEDLSVCEGVFAESNNIVTYHSSFGVLESGTNDFNSNIRLGGMTHTYIEVGSLRSVAVGARYSYRVYPDSYKDKCLKISHGEVYLRIKLGTL